MIQRDNKIKVRQRYINQMQGRKQRLCIDFRLKMK